MALTQIYDDRVEISFSSLFILPAMHHDWFNKYINIYFWHARNVINKERIREKRRTYTYLFNKKNVEKIETESSLLKLNKYIV